MIMLCVYITVEYVKNNPEIVPSSQCKSRKNQLVSTIDFYKYCLYLFYISNYPDSR